MRCAGPLSCCSRSPICGAREAASERVGSGSGNFLKRRLGEQARASYSAGAHLPTETSSHGGESRRFICSRPLGCLGVRMCALASARPLPARAPACTLGLKPFGATSPASRRALLRFALPPEDDRVCYKPNECGLLSRTGINSRPSWSALGCDSLTDNILIGGDACQHGLSARASAGLPGPACHADGGPARISCWCLFAIRRSRPKFARLAPSSSENPVVHLAQNAPKTRAICLR